MDSCAKREAHDGHRLSRVFSLFAPKNAIYTRNDESGSTVRNGVVLDWRRLSKPAEGGRDEKWACIGFVCRHQGCKWRLSRRYGDSNYCVRKRTYQARIKWLEMGVEGLLLEWRPITRFPRLRTPPCNHALHYMQTGGCERESSNQRSKLWLEV
jgi:hypothetical protein